MVLLHVGAPNKSEGRLSRYLALAGKPVNHHYHLHVMLLQGDPKAQICDFCDDNSMDLLVVTSTVRGRIKKALSPMGGVSSQLVLEAPCPVLVLPTQAASKCPALLVAHTGLY